MNPDLGAPALEVGEWPDPQLRPGWVVVRVAYAGVNRNDVLWLKERNALPARSVIGSDGAGTVVAVGDGVTSVDVGTQVLVDPTLWWGAGDDAPADGFQLLGFPTQGTHAELVSVPAENVHRLPGRLGVDAAAALPLAGGTAWRAMVTRGGLSAGQTVVVTAASAGVGTFAVQMGAALGARVIAVTSTPEKAAAAVRLGAHSAVLRTSPGYAEELRAAVGEDGADLVMDSAGADWPVLLSTLRRGGRLVTVGRTAGLDGSVDIWRLFWEHLSILGSSLASPRDVAALLAHLETATWAPVVDAVIPVDDAAAAYARQGDPGRIGKVVLDLT